MINRMNSAVVLCGILFGLTAAGAHAADPTSYSTTFDSMTPGSIYGQEGWNDQNAANGSVYDQSVTSGAGLGGSNAWLLSNITTDGANAGIASPTLAYAGSGVDSRGNVPVGNQYSESFNFRTVSSTSETGLDIANSIGQAASIRDTYLELYESGGMLYADDYATDASGNFTINDVSPALTWGAWYQVNVTADFNPGPNNDLVTYTILNAAGNVVWSDTIGSWESYYANDPTAEGAPDVDVNRVSWDLSTDSSPDNPDSTDTGIYIDNFSESVSEAPEPPAALLIVAGVGALAVLSRRKFARVG